MFEVKKPYREEEEAEEAISIMKSIRPRGLRNSHFNDATVCSAWGWGCRRGNEKKGVLMTQAAGSIYSHAVKAKPKNNRKDKESK